MKKIPNWIIIAILLALIIGSKFIFFPKKEDKSQFNKSKNKAPVGVNYYVLKSTKINKSVFASGKIGAFNQIDIVSEINGKITTIFFKEGETVTKGSILVKLNDADWQAQLLKSKTQISLSEQKLERLKKLIEINGVSQEEYDIQKNELNNLKAEQTYILTQIAKTTITAPFTGVIGLKNLSEGSYITPNMSVASLVQLNPLFIEFSIPEKYINLFRKGITIKFTNEQEDAKETYTAKIYAIEPRIDELTKTLKARASFDGNTLMYPGSFVKVYANLGETPNALMVPTQCVIPTLKGQKVFVSRRGIAHEIAVKIGIRTDEKIQITEGLVEGDTLITTGLFSMKKDIPVKLLKPVI